MVQSINLNPDAARHSERVADHLRTLVRASGGWMSFERWMSEALYAPGLGYYAAGNVKLAGVQSRSATTVPTGPQGDFVTAPQIGPLFARTLASQVAAVLAASESTQVLEFGAGTGALAADLIDTLDGLGVNVTYAIVEVSADLRAVQRTHLARFGDRVSWRDTLPTAFTGCVLANELLDAMPVRAFAWDDQAGVLERGVALDDAGAFVWALRPADSALAALVAERMPPMAGYVSEVNLQAEAWMASLATWLTRGAAILIDYGFPQSEFYHPQRAGGTLMAHINHHAHAEVLAAPGIQDITAHVDFTAMAQAALDGGLDLLGYISQGRFLMNAGLGNHLDAAGDIRRQTQMLAAVNTLTSEAEMGELFKVMAVGRGIDVALSGFSLRDRRHML